MKNKIESFFSNDTTENIARKILGMEITYRNQTGGIIVETEAYLGEKDNAAHAYKGHRSPANEPLYGKPGTIYIYRIHSYYNLDIATQDDGVPQGILIRALEPSMGIDTMKKNRPNKSDFDLTNGPGKLTQALGVQTTALNKFELNENDLNINLVRKKEPANIIAGPRIGIKKDNDWTDKHLRYYVDGNPYVSKMRKRDINLKSYGWK